MIGRYLGKSVIWIEGVDCSPERNEMSDGMTRAVFGKLRDGEFPIGHEHYGEKSGRDGISFMGSVRDGTLDVLSLIPEGERFNQARSDFDHFQRLEEKYREHKVAGGDCSKGSPGQDIRTRSEKVIYACFDSVLAAFR